MVNSAEPLGSVVITGVSTGIGYATASVLIGHGVHVFGSVRTQEDRERLEREFGSGHFTPMCFDVTDEAEIRSAAATVRERLNGRTLLGLVNNAGIATAGPLLHQPITEFRCQQEVNLIGQLAVTQAFAPLIGTDRSLDGPPGRIVMMSSVSGKMAVPFVGAYSASKHGLEGMAEALRRELILYGIDVVIIGPGPIATPIWDKAEQMMTSSPYADTEYGQALRRFGESALAQGRNGCKSELVGQVVWKALTARRPHTRYTVVRQPLVNWLINRLPKRLLDRIITKELGLTPKKKTDEVS